MEKEAEEQELRRLKNMKRAELKSRLFKIQGVAGTKSLDPVANTLDGDFDPDEHDRRMQEVFNDDYYADDDDELPEDIMAGLDEDLGKFAHTADETDEEGAGAGGSTAGWDAEHGDDGDDVEDRPEDIDVEQHEEVRVATKTCQSLGVRFHVVASFTPQRIFPVS